MNGIGMNICKWMLPAVLFALMAGCGMSDTAATASPTMNVPPPEASNITPATPKSTKSAASSILVRSPMTLSNNLLPGMSRKDIYLRLQLVRGTYSENWKPGAYRGTLYEGDYEFVIADAEGQTLSVTPLDKLFPGKLMFTQHFSLAFQDYNGDGVPDFTLGQRADSKGGFYKILTIAEDLSIRELPVRGAEFLYISKGEEGGSSYSLKLGRTKTGLLAFSSYSRNQGKYIDHQLLWQNGEFVPVTP